MQPVLRVYLQRAMLALLPVALVTLGADAVEWHDWGTTIENQGKRFTVLKEYNGEAVLDNETLLVWERSPSERGAEWTSAPMRCAVKSVGGRKGWRLPAFYELMTLVDPSVKGSPATPKLSNGHPFTDVKATLYWSGTAHPADPTSAYAVDFLLGDVALHGKNGIRGYWCVRGGAPDQERHRLDHGHQMAFSGPLMMQTQSRYG